jgi:hypothetical protein
MDLSDVLVWLKTASEEEKKEIEKALFPSKAILEEVLGALLEDLPDEDSRKNIRPELIRAMFTSDCGEDNDD